MTFNLFTRLSLFQFILILTGFGFSFIHASNTQDFMEEISSKGLNQYLNLDSVKTYGEDFGGIVQKTPLAVFSPATIKNLQEFLPIASAFNIKVNCRGRGNSAYGQSQTQGIIIDLKNLTLPMHYISENFSSVSVPGFKTWAELIEFTQEKNMTVPVTIDNLNLTVAGTLSFGALGGTSYRCGSGADNVIELDVVTMDGKLHKCSPTENTELFEAVLCGMGQFGIIIQAILPLIPAKEKVNVYKFLYDDPQHFLNQQRLLYEANLFDHLKGSVHKNKDVWEYVIEAAVYYNDKEDSRILDQIQKLTPRTHTMTIKGYYEFINAVTFFTESLRKMDKLSVPHPWYTVLLPSNIIEKHLASALSSPHLTGLDPIIVYPMDSHKFNRHLFVKPNSPIFYLLGVLHNTSPKATKDYPSGEIVSQNMDLLKKAQKEGGSRYPIDAIPFTQENWQMHYREKWETVNRLKQKYDPQHLLGSDIFN